MTMIIQVMSRKHGHKQYLVEPEQKQLKHTLAQIEELQPNHNPPHVLHVKMQGQMEPMQLTEKQLLNAKLDSVEKVLVRPVLMAG